MVILPGQVGPVLFVLTLIGSGLKGDGKRPFLGSPVFSGRPSYRPLEAEAATAVQKAREAQARGWTGESEMVGVHSLTLTAGRAPNWPGSFHVSLRLKGSPPPKKKERVVLRARNGYVFLGFPREKVHFENFLGRGAALTFSKARRDRQHLRAFACEEQARGEARARAGRVARGAGATAGQREGGGAGGEGLGTEGGRGRRGRRGRSERRGRRTSWVHFFF